VRPGRRLEEIGVLSVENRLFQAALDRVVVERGSGLPQEERQRLPVREEVRDRLPESGVRFDEMIGEQAGQPRVQIVEQRPAVGRTSTK
jgi:hypothetical protein